MEELSSLITRTTFSNAYFPHTAAGMCTVVSPNYGHKAMLQL